jgi:hypothetical protein
MKCMSYIPGKFSQKNNYVNTVAESVLTDVEVVVL